MKYEIVRILSFSTNPFPKNLVLLLEKNSTSNVRLAELSNDISFAPLTRALCEEPVDLDLLGMASSLLIEAREKHQVTSMTTNEEAAEFGSATELIELNGCIVPLLPSVFDEVLLHPIHKSHTINVEKPQLGIEEESPSGKDMEKPSSKLVYESPLLIKNKYRKSYCLYCHTSFDI